VEERGKGEGTPERGKELQNILLKGSPTFAEKEFLKN
jgi:hypothetical protein